MQKIWTSLQNPESSLPHSWQGNCRIPKNFNFYKKKKGESYRKEYAGWRGRVTAFVIPVGRSFWCGLEKKKASSIFTMVWTRCSFGYARCYCWILRNERPVVQLHFSGINARLGNLRKSGGLHRNCLGTLVLSFPFLGKKQHRRSFFDYYRKSL